MVNFKRLAIVLLLTACSNADEKLGESAAPIAQIGSDDFVTLSSGNNNNLLWNWNSSIINLTPASGGSTVTGIDAQYPPNAGILFFRNLSAVDSIVFTHMDTNSLTADRLNLPGGQNFTVTPGAMLGVSWLTGGGGSWRALTPPTNTGPQGATGDTGAAGETGATGAAGAGFDVISSASPSRSFGSAFEPSETRPVLVHYSVRIASTINLSGGAAGRVELLSDASDPSTVRARCAGGITGTAVIGLAMTDVSECELTYLVPAGDEVLLQTVNETGTPTFTITKVDEQTL